MTTEKPSAPLQLPPFTIISRPEARRIGLKRFFTGKPCIRGHLAERLTSGGYCTACNVEFARIRRAADPEGARARDAVYKEANRERLITYRKKFYQDNKAREGERHRKFVEHNREWVLAYQRAYRAANPEKHQTYDRNHKSRRKGAEGRHTKADIDRIRKQQKGKCAYCRRRLDDEERIDHIIAIANGGTNWPSNIQLTCNPCNQRKKAKDPIVWAREMGKLI